MGRHLAAALVLSTLSTSCATIMSGSSDDVLIDSRPQGAAFSTNTGAQGVTPQQIVVPSSSDIVVTFEKEGYSTTQGTLRAKTSPWIAGNILAGGLVGLLIDMASPNAKTHDATLVVDLLHEEILTAENSETFQWKPSTRVPSNTPGTRDIVVRDVMQNGAGPRCGTGNVATVEFRVLDAKTMSSKKDMDSYSFEVGSGEATAGWHRMVQDMRVGDHLVVFIPKELAYGNDKGDLIFEMHLVDVQPAG